MPNNPNPPHPLDRYAFRAGELRSPDGTDTGHVLVLPMVFWERIGGHLWWRRWGKPETTADVWVSAAAVEHPYHLGWFMDELLDEMLSLWDAGLVVVGRDLLYEVRWLGDHDSRTIAREVFDTDLDQERATRT
ncbi:hypothetical protein [Geodermatophilus sp. URMC 63]